MSDSRSEATRAEERKRRLEQKIQRQLDEALEDSFPASDPVSIVTSHEEEDWGAEPAPAPPTHTPESGTPSR
jgi:hypothetical protein